MSFFPSRLNFSTIRNKVVIFTGGINESVTNIELRPGELTACVNYMEVDGSANGYISSPGYERYDGTALASSIVVSEDGDGNITDDTAREARRAAITTVPGTGSTLGITSYEGTIYAFRNNSGGTAADMYEATSSGWSQVTGTSLNVDGDYDFAIGRMATYKSNQACLYFVDGVSDPHTYDGSTVATITTGVTGSYPTQVGLWKNRLFLAYPGGHLLFSALGDPTDWTTTSITGEIYIGDDIVDIIEAPGGALIVFCKDSIHAIYNESTDADFIFRKEEFSTYSGAIGDTVQRMLGTLYFADDRGITTLDNVEAFGDFKASSINKKAQEIYRAYKSYITASVVDRERGQYILFFDLPESGDTLALVFTFSINERGYKYLKGTGVLQFPDKIMYVTSLKTEGRDTEIYFGSTEGYVYKYDSGTSFDGLSITTKMATSFYHYGSPVQWKLFRRVNTEISAEKGTIFNIKNEFNYNDASFPTPITTLQTITDSAGSWGVDSWGSFRWGSGRYLTQISQTPLGYGTNMRMLVQTSSKYKEKHTIHNMIVEYTIGSRRT